MDDLERDKMLVFAYQLRERELEPFTWDDPFSDMGTDEKSKLLVEFMNQNHSLKEIVELMKAERASSLDYKVKFEEEHKLREEGHKLNIGLQSRLDKLLQTIDSLCEQLDLMNQHRYGSKTQKRKSTQSKSNCADHTKAKDDFDGTPGSVGMDSTSAASAEESNEQTSVKAEKGKLSAEQIKACRENLKTKEIIIKIRSKLDAMLSDVHPPRGDLMEKALNYLNTFWIELFVYTRDGSYTIDNSIAERFIWPLSGERKNSLFFGSGRITGVSAAYHTIISTCKMQGVSALQYFKMFFREIVNGRDYENLLPMTIGLSNNKL